MEQSKNLYHIKRKISKNVSTDMQDIQKYIHRCARYAMQRPNSGSIRCKEQFSINPRAERLELGRRGNIYSFDANDGEQNNNRYIWKLLSIGVCLSFRFGFAREKAVYYCQKMFTCFASQPDTWRTGGGNVVKTC